MNDAQQPNHQPTDEASGRFGLTADEYNDVKSLLRYGAAIFAAVGGTLIVVALASLVVRSL